MNAYMHGPSFFLLHFASLSSPKLSTTILPLYKACKMWKITALTWEISSWKLVEKFHIRFPMYYSLCNWIGEQETTKLKKKNFLRIQKKDTKTSTKRHKWNRMTPKRTFWYFLQCACVNIIYFAQVVTTTYRMKNNKSSTRGLSLEISGMLYIGAHLSVPHEDNI